MPVTPLDVFNTHMEYIARQDIEALVHDTYTDDCVLYHNFPYFPGDVPWVHTGQAAIIAAQQTIFAPENHGAIRARGEVFGVIEGTDSIMFQILIESPTKGLFLNTDFWLIRDGKLWQQYVLGYRLGDL